MSRYSDTSSDNTTPIINSRRTSMSTISLASDAVGVPAVLKSQETYVYIGFTEERAADLWARYSKYGDEVQGDFIDFAIWHIVARRPDATSTSDDWDAYMRSLDINDKLRRAILLPEFEDIRYTASCKFWVLDAITLAYETLSPPAEASQPSVAAISSAPPVIPEGHSVIWRGGVLHQAEAFYDEQTQEVNLAAISKVGDFSGMTRHGYFTPQRETADRYAQWTKHKLPDAEIAIVQVAVPDTLVRTLAVEYLWSKESQSPTDDWKNLIWRSRRGRDIPRELDYLDEKDLLIGHIASGKECKYSDMTDYRQIRESDVLHVEIDGDERKGIQWVFNTRKARRGFEEQCRGKIWIHRLGAFKVPKDCTGI